MGTGAKTMSEKAGWEDPGVIENKQVLLAQQAGKVPKVEVMEGSGPSIKVQKARSSPIRECLLGNQVFRKMVIEVGD